MSPAPVLKAALDSGICSPKRPPGSHPQALSLLASPSRGSKLQSQYSRLGDHIYTWQTGHLYENGTPVQAHGFPFASSCMAGVSRFRAVLGTPEA